MSDEDKTKGLAEETNVPAGERTSNGGESSSRSFRLVGLMLAILGTLTLVILVVPLWKPPEKPEALLEYYKWCASVLFGAFGAWIGAGAAYFFGRENLMESSRSTESAMRIQNETLQRPSLIERIKDMTLTAMNPNFFFHLEDKKKDVKVLLAKFKGYWFVPIMEKDSGILKDIVHAQVFWDPDFDEEATLAEIITQMDTDEMDKKKGTRKLHGESFYARVSSNDKIGDVYSLICQRDAEVAIVVDERGKASHCLSKTDLRTFLKVADNK